MWYKIRAYLSLFGNSIRLIKGCDNSHSIISLFWDMVRCLIRYDLRPSDYVANGIWKLDPDGRDCVCRRVAKSVAELHKARAEYYREYRFLKKWSAISYSQTLRMSRKRTRSYAQRYHAGAGLWVEHGVMVTREREVTASMVIGKNVLLARDADIDYTGGLQIGDGVKIMEGVKILTHSHDVLHWRSDDDLEPHTNRVFKTPLKIGRNCQLCARAIILPGVGEIGANSMISAGAVVTKSVPANVIVAGNPAKVVAEIPAEIELHAEFLP